MGGSSSLGGGDAAAAATVPDASDRIGTLGAAWDPNDPRLQSVMRLARLAAPPPGQGQGGHKKHFRVIALDEMSAFSLQVIIIPFCFNAYAEGKGQVIVHQ